MAEGNLKIFVVEDNEWYNKLLVHNLSLNPDHQVQGFHSGKELLEQLHQQPDVVTLDYKLPDLDGIKVLKEIKSQYEDIEVIIISEQEDIETAVELIQLGAYDYIVKSKDIRDRLLNTVGHIAKKDQLKKKISHLQKEVERKYDFQNTIIGASPSIKKVFGLIEKALPTDITVTVTGETGTGKELVAKAIHYNSKRKDHSFVAVNVAAIPAELIESELFGHEKGAFTGAAFRRIGKFEEANKGTLFLDEIGEMDLVFQAKLLRVLQEKEVVRIGSNEPVKTNCRIVVATNRNLEEEVKLGNFREDLYYRLFGLKIDLPPLRERDKDVLLLARHFIGVFCKENDLAEKKLTSAAQKKLLSHQFPGNIRELKSVVELAVVMASGSEVDAEDILLSDGDVLPKIIAKEHTLKEYEHMIVDTYLKKYNDNVGEVAKRLDISQSTIYRMLKRKAPQD